MTQTTNKPPYILGTDNKVTRFEVIDHTKASIEADQYGRILMRHNKTPLRLEIDIQDNGRTVKVFMSDAPSKS